MKDICYRGMRNPPEIAWVGKSWMEQVSFLCSTLINDVRARNEISAARKTQEILIHQLFQVNMNCSQHLHTHKLHHSYNLKNKIWSIVNSFSRNLNLNSVTPTWMDFCKTSFSGTFFCWEILLQDGCRNFLDGLQVNIFWCIECQEVLKGKHVKELRPQDLGPSKTFDKIWKAAKKVNRQE